ncbi:hypothetical protein B0T17DRAFT_49395 [Bombardia bombarda]|uniref:Uncharacterized protein n=1 Tax=Bombardia bombarda TaxID=252184 RepID=A0AA40CE99_9PEZI|nr:hypothetical protein B0T17DRAFT_49395 [Bombardia bombarda]
MEPHQTHTRTQSFLWHMVGTPTLATPYSRASPSILIFGDILRQVRKASLVLDHMYCIFFLFLTLVVPRLERPARLAFKPFRTIGPSFCQTNCNNSPSLPSNAPGRAVQTTATAQDGRTGCGRSHRCGPLTERGRNKSRGGVLVAKWAKWLLCRRISAFIALPNPSPCSMQPWGEAARYVATRILRQALGSLAAHFQLILPPRLLLSGSQQTIPIPDHFFYPFHLFFF